MKLSKAVYDPQVKSKNLVTTITGVVSIAISALVLFGIVNSTQGADLTQYATMIVTAVAGIISIFKAKDA